MHAFKDCLGREWFIEIHVSAVRKLRASVLALDLMALTGDGAKGLGQLLSDPVRLIDAIYLLCQDQAAKLSISDEEFGRGFRGDVIEAAADAFVEELIDFSQSPKDRQNLRAIISKSREVADLMQATAADKIEAIDPAQVLRTWLRSSTNAPESSASIPVLSPSANCSA